MTKGIIWVGIVMVLLSVQKQCKRANESLNCFKGRLEIKGICSNYTIKVLEGAIDSTRFSTSWTDENTNKTYSNVFALDSPCSFPADIKQGDEFYFTIRTEGDKNCNVCMAYYPTPPKRLSISVSKTACP